jgi:hypothetical protein
MTDHTDLILRLRNMLNNETVKDRFYAIADASDAIEAQAKQIEVLERDAVLISDAMVALTDRVQELKAALTPFAEVVERYAYCLPESGMPAVAEDDVIMFELMYFLQARKVLENSAADWEAQDRALGEKE